jgi:hypothetical protein
MKVFRGHRYLYHSSNICCLAISKDGYQGNICCTICLFLPFLLGVATKTCDKTQELPLEECYHIFSNYRGITFSKITISLCPQNGTDGQNLGVWLTIYISLTFPSTYVPCTLFLSSATSLGSISQATTYERVKGHQIISHTVGTHTLTFLHWSSSFTVMFPVPGPTSNTTSVGRNADWTEQPK